MEPGSSTSIQCSGYRKKVTDLFVPPRGILLSLWETSDEVILSVAELFDVDIFVHHGMKHPVVFRPSIGQGKYAIHLQCITGIHYNPVTTKIQGNKVESMITDRHVNILVPEASVSVMQSQRMPVIYEDEELQICRCTREVVPYAGCIVDFLGACICGIIDTGAMINAVNESTYRGLLERGLVTHHELNGNLSGLVCGVTVNILGFVDVTPKIEENLFVSSPFAIIRDNEIPCCAILGANFLDENDLVVDLCNYRLILNEDREDTAFVQLYCPQSAKINTSTNDNFFGMCIVEEPIPEEEDVIEVIDNEDDDDEEREAENVKITIKEEYLRDLQNRNFAIRLLKRNITNNLDPREWRKCLSQFKKHAQNMCIINGLLFLEKDDRKIPVVSFDFAVEVTNKIHTSLAHLGRGKLIELVTSKFWHPACDKIARDICGCCVYCQSYKRSNLTVKPPTLRIQSSYPFELVAVDLLKYPESNNGYIYCLVAVDHFSKFLAVAPLKDKKGITVCRAFEEQILAKMLKTPTKLLSDNGLEFRNKDLDEMLNKYNIEHIHTTSRCAQSNGACERVNQSITVLLNGIIYNDISVWDVELPRSVIIYNSTYHTQIKSSPSRFLIEKSHDMDSALPLDAGVVSSWKPGHPSFAPLRVNEKVMKKVHLSGHQLTNKFAKRYDGPYTVTKVNSNGVTYEIADESGNVFRVHYKQVKLFHEVPNYLKLYLEADINNVELNEVVNNTANESNVSCNDFSGFNMSNTNDFSGFCRSNDAGMIYEDSDLSDSEDESVDVNPVDDEQFSKLSEDYSSYSEESDDYAEDELPNQHREELVQQMSKQNLQRRNEVSNECEINVPGEQSRVTCEDECIDIANFSPITPVSNDMSLNQISSENQNSVSKSNNISSSADFSGFPISPAEEGRLLRVLEQTIRFQEEVIHNLDEGVRNSINQSGSTNVTSFGGYSGDSSLCCQLVRRNLIRSIKENTNSINKSIRHLCVTRNFLKRRLNERENSEDSARVNIVDLSDEIADTLSPLPVINPVLSHRYNLRSRARKL